ncbi:AAA family ATPase [Cohnella mopanensis]|uniref:AAA family ATPase n=1 Tax=Cohnella mopanensis TaxID=2911966 RepID=UPI001EF7EC39|nr:AAA family ATPase [Cohnella mopanensis]
MYIRELHVEGYGALQGVKLELEAPVSVLYGPNEAGKSTLLRFVRSMLYGFPTRKEPVERGEPVFGGRHGGRLLLTDKNGSEWTMERFAERGGEVTLRDHSGLERNIGQAEWQRMMLGGISERTFKQLFSVSLNELHELRTLQGEEIGNYLYHAGLAGGSAVTSARRQIGNEMDRLFRPKGTTQEMNRLLSAIKEIESAIRHSRDGVQAYQDAKETLVQVELRLRSIEEGMPERRMQAAKLQGAFELREWWLKREMLLAEDAELRRELPDPSAPLVREDSSAAWVEWKKQRNDATRQLEVIGQELAEYQMMRGKLAWNEDLLASYPELERLEAAREAVMAKRDELTELEAERRTLDESVQNVLPRLSGNWGEAELLAFGGLAADRDEVRALQQEWEQEERVAASLQAELRRLSRQKEVLQTEYTSSDAHSRDELSFRHAKAEVKLFGLFVPQTKPALLQAWHNVEDARREYERARTSFNPSGSSVSRVSAKSGKSNRLTYTIAGMIGAIALALPVVLNDGDHVSAYVYGLAACLLLLSAAIAIVASRRSAKQGKASSSANRLMSDENKANLRFTHKQLKDKLRQLVEHSETAAADLVSDLPDNDFDFGDAHVHSDTLDSDWQQLRGAVHDQLERLEERNRVQSKQQEWQERLLELQLERDLVERDSLEHAKRMDTLRWKWQEWLKVRQLPIHLKPDGLPELFGLAEQAQAALRQLRRVTERSQALQASIQQFEQAVYRLMEAFPSSIGNRTDVIQAIHSLHKEAERQLEAKEEAERIERLLASVQAASGEARIRIEHIEHGIAKLFREAQVDSEAEFELRLRLDERCRVIRKEARDIQLRLESGRDNEALEHLYGLLKSNDDATLSALLSEKQREGEAEDELRAELLDQRGRMTQELERLRSIAEDEDQSQRLRELQSKLEHLTERYAVLAICERLIVQAKAVFEEEKQPEVLQRASRYFRQMTNGAYLRIVAPGDTKALLAETKDRRLLDSSYLSRGTQEQLYLSMRFALCDAASPEQPLPLLLDDLFVHFDEQRLVQALPVLEELAKDRQIVLFTCHRYVAQTIVAGIPASRMLMLGS